MKTITTEEIIKLSPCLAYTPERIEELRKQTCGRRKKITFNDCINANIPD